MIRAKFWIIYRGAVEVTVAPRPGLSADSIAWTMICAALATFNAKGGPPASVRALVCQRVQDLKTGRAASHPGPLFP